MRAHRGTILPFAALAWIALASLLQGFPEFLRVFPLPGCIRPVLGLDHLAFLSRAP